MEQSNRFETAAVILAVCAGAFIMPMMSTMLNPALGKIGTEFNIGSTELSLVVSVFILATVISMIPCARLANAYGRKRIFAIGVLLTISTAILSFFAPSFEFLLILRFIMGFGASMVSVVSAPIVADFFPPDKRGWALGIYTLFVYIGMASGPTIGGLITDAFGWRSTFMAVLPFTIVSLMFISYLPKNSKIVPLSKSFVGISAVYMIAIAFVSYSMMNPLQTYAIPFAIIGVVMLSIFIYLNKKGADPILDTKIFKYKMFTMSCLAAFMNYGSSYALTFFLSLYLLKIGLLTAAETGLILMLQPLMQVLLTAWLGKLTDIVKDKRILPTSGMVLTTIGIGMLFFLESTVNLWYVGSILVITGLGLALFAVSNLNTTLSSVPKEYRNEASGTLATLRQGGTMLSMAFAACAIAFVMGSSDFITPETFDSFIVTLRAMAIFGVVMGAVGTYASWARGKESGIEE